ncbi:UvrD-helicase domain-containing protein [Allostreptomyces psammosilenae]|uniref:DNA 3'-5' helicase n=1 Tax=Allostreptomyces psammosilenae TaxID=1892865 RepID=A0A852ZP59_9ACTN|nr:UvrD-helicase domain-containing protein [Allostreptomyces psammosilenae]NYI04159.1 superfamily I DNA/RNA helicase [Allostreptomyces psammosilenae]
MPQLAFASSFFEEYERLEKTVRKGVREVMAKFQALTVTELLSDRGLRLEQLARARDPRIRTIRINQAWRGVVLAPDDGGDTYVLLKVAHHDKANAWAVRHVASVNSATRGLEVRNVEALETLTPTFERTAGATATRLLQGVSDADLRRLGIDDHVLRVARTLVDKGQLEVFGAYLPEDQFEVLQFLAEGFTPEEVWRDVVAVRRPTAPGPHDPDDLSTAITHTRSRIALVSGPRELQDILTKPFAAWRIFLHPAQRRVAYRPSYAGPAQISGGPGTGKTVVALHRVRHLLERQGERESPERVLLTTYTNALAAALRESLDSLVDDPRLLPLVDVITVNTLAHRVVRRATGRTPEMVDSRQERLRWQRIAAKLELPWSEQFLALEYRHVVLGQGVTTSEEYLRASRAGRGSRLGPLQRARLWRAVEEFTGELAVEDRRTYLQICEDAARLLGRPGTPPPYRHVVVDEAQDLHPAQWRVLRAAVPPGPDDLFIAGDPHQRIYDCRVSLRSLGINVTGRSTRLRINYRSTEEILSWATALLTGERIEDLEGDGRDDLLGYRSALRGERPVLRGTASVTEELDAVARQVRAWTEADVRPAEIAVATRFHDHGERVRQRLEAEGIPVVALRDAPPADAPGVRIATMHAMKGLEFRCVAVAGVTAAALPAPKAITPPELDPLQHEADLLAERCLLFVACTRAREALHVSYSGTPSPFLPLPDTESRGGDDH